MYSKLDTVVEEDVVGGSPAIRYVLDQVRDVAKMTTSGFTQLIVAGPCCDSLRIEEEQ
jgi:hypothetical protein